MIFLQEITEDLLTKDDILLYIHTPFCGTCHIARAILTQIEKTLDQHMFYEMNASFFPTFMKEYKIESVPCLFIKSGGIVKEKVYTFHSTANIVYYLSKYKPELFTNKNHLLS